MPLFSQSYLSHASEPLSLDQLQKLNEQSDAYNETHGLSGVLYYNDGLFFQTLEGEKSEVQSLIERIAKDPRHERITHLSAIDIDKRVFPLWTMKFFTHSFADRHPSARLKMMKDQDDFVYRLHTLFLRDQQS